MTFRDFISYLNPKDKQTFDNYSIIRGQQQYRIVFEALSKKSKEVTFKDVNSLVVFDKAIKDVLFKYLGTLEEMIRNDIVLRFDFEHKNNIQEKEYHYFKYLPSCVKSNQPLDGITLFYKCFSLNFGDLVSFIEKYDKETYEVEKLKEIVKLRNKVMHHSLLLFNYTYDSTVVETRKKIDLLIEFLPSRYKSGIRKNLLAINNKTKGNISFVFHPFLLLEGGK